MNNIVPAATSVLPPGSDSVALQAAINSAAYGDTIELSSNMSFVSPVTVPAGMAVTVRSATGNTWSMNQFAAGSRHFLVEGQLTLTNINLYGGTTYNPDGSVATPGGGGVQLGGSGALNVNAGGQIEFCYADDGGGINGSAGTTIIISGGVVARNAAVNGGGIYTAGDITLHSGAIVGNWVSLIGGGIYHNGTASGVNLYGGFVNANRAAGSGGIGGSGGGVYAFQPSSTVMIDGCTIAENTAIYGGGVMSNGAVYLGSGSISENTAQNGGGVYMTGYGMSGPLATFTMTGGEVSQNTAQNGGGVYARGNLPGTGVVLHQGSIRGNHAETGGGIYLAFESGGASTLTMDGGAVSANTATNYGGGVFADDGASVTITGATVGSLNGTDGNVGGSGGGIYVSGANTTLTLSNMEIIGNRATDSGGGLYVDGSDATMQGVSVRRNTAAGDGGGIYVYNNRSLIDVTLNTVTVENEVINENTAGRNGGGVFLNAVNNNTTIFALRNGEVSANMAEGNGGGFSLAGNSTLSVEGASLVNNHAAQNGGAIYTADTSYGNIATALTTIFDGNTAVMPYTPPENAAALYPNIQFLSTSVANHPLNNFDINYTQGEPLTFAITYNANGGIGGRTDIGMAYGARYTLLTPQAVGISRAGYTFTGWNTQPNGGGTAYAPGNTITVTQSLLLYAQWRAGGQPMPPCTSCHCAPCRCICPPGYVPRGQPLGYRRIDTK